MQWINLRAKGWGKQWGRPNLMRNKKKKRKHLKPNNNMEQLDEQKIMHPPLELAQDLRHMWHELESMSKMMLEKEWSCNLLEMFSWNQFIPLSTNYTKGGMQATAFGGNSFCATLGGFGRGMDQNFWNTCNSKSS
jgi:hypothetical protein